MSLKWDTFSPVSPLSNFPQVWLQNKQHKAMSNMESIFLLLTAIVILKSDIYIKTIRIFKPCLE